MQGRLRCDLILLLLSILGFLEWDQVYSLCFNVNFKCHRFNTFYIKQFQLFSTPKKNLDDFKWDPKKYPKLDFNENYYRVLEVDESADPNTIKKSYYKIVFKYHPDNKQTIEEKSLANQQMMVINSAFKVLKDPVLRKNYDQRLRQSTDTKRPQYDSKSSSTTKSAKVNQNTFSKEYSYEDFLGYKNRNDEQSSESLADILSDMWNDIQNNKGVNLMEDLNEIFDNSLILEDFESKSLQELQNKASFISKTITDLEAKENELKNLRNIEKAISLVDGDLSNRKKVDSVSASSEEILKQIDEQLRRRLKLEELNLRINEISKQLTKLKRIKVSLSTVADQKAKINVNDSTSNSNQYSNYYSRPESQTRGNSSPKMSKDDLIDEQLRKMKKDMGIM